MAKLFLHAGGYKTGSTAIQAYLMENRAVLAERGLVTPLAGADKGGRHLPLVRTIVGEEVSAKVARTPDLLIDELAATPGHDVVISCETLEAQLPAALPFFRSLGRDLQVVLYVRNQPQKLNSGYVQEARMLRARHSFLDSVTRALIDTRLRYSAWLVRTDLTADEITFRPYSGAVREDVIGDFLTTLGVPRADLPPPASTRENVSMSAVGVAALRMLSRWSFDEALLVKAKARNQIVEIIEQEDAALGLPTFQGFDAALFEHITRNFHGDNQWFAQEVWGTSWADQFGDDLAPLDQPNEINVDGEETTLLGEARRVFAKARELFDQLAQEDNDDLDDLPDLGFMLERKVDRARAAD
jgi:hypothetical protein